MFGSMGCIITLACRCGYIIHTFCPHICYAAGLPLWPLCRGVRARLGAHAPRGDGRRDARSGVPVVGCGGYEDKIMRATAYLPY